MLTNSLIKVVILAGQRDFGRCPIASRLPTPLWPVAGEPALRRLLFHLANQGVRDVTICSNGDSSLLKKVIDIENIRTLDVHFLDEPLPIGTAGSIRDAANGKADELLLVFPASMVRPPDIGSLTAAHQGQAADLTVMFNPGLGNDKTRGEAVSIYVCNPSVLEYIPAEGYYDVKESLIPELLRIGKRVRYAVLPHSAGNFRDRQGYLDAIGDYLENATETGIDLKMCERNDKHIVWKDSGVTIESGAKIYGRVVLLDGVRIESGAVIFGPTILGRNVSIGRDSVVVNSILWDDSRVGENCEVQRCVIDYNVVVPNNSVAEGNCIPFEPKGSLKGWVTRVSKLGKQRAGRLRQRLQHEFVNLDGGLSNQVQRQRRNILPWLMAGIVSIAFLWSYWPGIVDLWNIWQRSDEYSSGLLVPFLAVYILWSRRQQITGVKIQPSLWGLPAFVGAQAVRFFGLFFMYSSAERLSIVLSIAALVLLLFGRDFFRKVSPIVLFLFLMLPWPNRVQAALALPLQQWATSSAVFCLEVMGYEVAHEGNIIHIGQASVAVAEACNGLRMITAFFVISGLVVLLVERAWWEKLIVFASSLPIALFCNTVRLAVTAIAFTVLEGEYWEKIFHDFGGYAMMPLAIVIVIGEFWFLAKLTTATKEDRIVVVKGAK
ncbi:MAG: exosortase [Sedimentisphaerales bacterium]|nr:exosortase [Sedimentisphaerales bacterium]